MRVVLIQGGGVGFDQETAVRRILEAAGVAIDWQVVPAGKLAIEQEKNPLSDEVVAAVRQSGVALKTKLFSRPGDPSFNVEFRKRLGLFASVRPLRDFPGLPARFRDIDILLVREITEDLYSAIEHEIVPGVVQSIKVVTEPACLRFFRFAFELARALGRKTIHCIHKANILKLADGLFLDCFRRTAREFPEITPKEMIVDNCCMQLVTRPQQFDMLVAGNLYGDLLSDLGAGLIGGISATAAINYADGVRVYEAIHGASRETVGADRANPLPLLFPALAMLRDHAYGPAADRVQKAVERVLTETPLRTFDLGGTALTSEITSAIISRLSS